MPLRWIDIAPSRARFWHSESDLAHSKAIATICPVLDCRVFAPLGLTGAIGGVTEGKGKSMRLGSLRIQKSLKDKPKVVQPGLLVIVCVILMVAPKGLTGQEIAGETERVSKTDTAEESSLKASDTANEPETDDSLSDHQKLLSAYKSSQETPGPKSLAKVVSTCEQVLSGTPNAEDQAYANQLLGWALLRQSEQPEVSFESAILFLDRAIELEPENWKPFFARAWHYGTQAQYAKAIEDLDRVLEMEPKLPRAWFNRAELHYQLENFVLAVRDYTRAIVLDPRDAQAYTGRGHAYFELAKYREAMSDYQKVVLLTEGEAAALIHRAEVAQIAGLWEKARDDFQLAAARDKTSGLPQIRLAWLYATCPDGSIANPELAVKLAERGVELRGEEDWAAANTLATACAASGDVERAEKILSGWLNRLEGSDLERLEATRRVVKKLSTENESK